MQLVKPFLHHIRQNSHLPIRIISPEFGHLTAEEANDLVVPQRSPYYFFMFMLDGCSFHEIDLQQHEVTGNQLVFVTPQQVHKQGARCNRGNYVKLGFDESCLSLLPEQYPFLLNPLNNHKITFAPAAALRVKAVFAILLDLLKHWDTPQELILAHLNSLCAEINTAYFLSARLPASKTSSRFLSFKLLVEKRLTEQLSVQQMAEELGVNPSGLYKLVKHHTGLSPKSYLTKRLILEARRRLYHKDHSIKELAFELGFNDPEYFSRLFKKVTGYTVTQLQDLSGN